MLVDNLIYLFLFCGSPVGQTGYMHLTEVRKITSASLCSSIALRAGCLGGGNGYSTPRHRQSQKARNGTDFFRWKGVFDIHCHRQVGGGQ